MAAGVLVVLFASSCSKKNDDTPKVEVDPFAGMAPYLPSSIYVNGAPMDSFVYNSDNTVSKMFAINNGNDTYDTYSEFTYDNTKRCTQVQHHSLPADPNGEFTDVLLYNESKLTKISTYTTDGVISKDTAVFTWNGNNLAMINNKDTIRNEEQKQVYYAEFLYADGNLASFMTFFYSSHDANTTKNTMTYTYDNKANGMQFFYAKNPVMAIFLIAGGTPLFAVGKNNIAGLASKAAVDNVEVTHNYTVNNTYDAVTGMLARQVISINDVPGLDLRFNYTKINK